jgi:Leucine-rich repeat (LRR) protein
VEGSSERIEEKRQTMPFREVSHLAFSFKNILKVENLQGLDNLVKLQMDNNVIQRIENLDHLVSTTVTAAAQHLRR